MENASRLCVEILDTKIQFRTGNSLRDDAKVKEGASGSRSRQQLVEGAAHQVRVRKGVLATFG